MLTRKKTKVTGSITALCILIGSCESPQGDTISSEAKDGGATAVALTGGGMALGWGGAGAAFLTGVAVGGAAVVVGGATVLADVPGYLQQWRNAAHASSSETVLNPTVVPLQEHPIEVSARAYALGSIHERLAKGPGTLSHLSALVGGGITEYRRYAIVEIRPSDTGSGEDQFSFYIPKPYREGMLGKNFALSQYELAAGVNEIYEQQRALSNDLSAEQQCEMLPSQPRYEAVDLLELWENQDSFHESIALPIAQALVENDPEYACDRSLHAIFLAAVENGVITEAPTCASGTMW